MPTMLSGARIREAIRDATFILDGVPDSVEAVKYDFHLGDRVLKAEYRQPKEISSISEEKRVVAPGETVFVLTKERLQLPRNMIATLVPKRKLAHGGISVMGGLAIDPEYKGVLVVGMHNFSSSPYLLRPGRKLIAAIFYELNNDELDEYPRSSPTEITDFPDDLVELISKYSPVELGGLQEELAATRRELLALKADIQNDTKWKEDFRIGLNEHNQQLGILIKGLGEEKDSRAKADERLHSELLAVDQKIGGFWTTLTSSFKVAWVVGGAAVAAVITFLVTNALKPALPPAVPNQQVATFQQPIVSQQPVTGQPSAVVQQPGPSQKRQ
jgi:dCTP deaminase